MTSKAHEHAYGSSVIPPGHANGGPAVHFPPFGPQASGTHDGVPGGPSVIPGTIGVAGTPKITNLGMPQSKPSPQSTIGQIVDDFCERLAGAIAGRVIELVRAELGPSKEHWSAGFDRAMALPVSDEKPGPLSAPMGQDADPLLAAMMGQTVTPAAGSPLAKQHEQIEFELLRHFQNDDRVRFLRHAPEAPAIRVVGFNTNNEFSDGGCHEIIVTPSKVQVSSEPLRLIVTAAGKHWYGIKTIEHLLAAIDAVAKGATPCECWQRWDWPGPFNKYTQRRREQYQRQLDELPSLLTSASDVALQRSTLERLLVELDRVWAHGADCFRPVDYTTEQPRSRHDSMSGLDFIE